MIHINTSINIENAMMKQSKSIDRQKEKDAGKRNREKESTKSKKEKKKWVGGNDGLLRK
jgi:hypothetical protein